MQKQKIILAADHAGVSLKNQIKKWLEESYAVVDVGAYTEDSVDYPDVVAKAVPMIEGSALGVFVCGSGIGVSIAANKHRGIRAALVHNNELAELAKQHNNANVLCLGARFTDFAQAKEIVDTFLTTEFEQGRHLRRVEKIEQI